MAIRYHVLGCPNCGGALPRETTNAGRMEACPTCRRQVRVEAFPALVTGVTVGRGGELVESDSDAGCFHHPHRKAVSHCEGCGRFLCGICEIDGGGRRFCSACFDEALRSGKGFPELVATSFSWEHLTILLGFLSLIPWLGLAPLLVMVFTEFRRSHRRRPRLVPATPAERFLIAALFIVAAVLQMLCLLAVLTSIF